MTPVRKPATVQCLGPVDASMLASRVGRLSNRAWRHRNAFKENNFLCFHHTWHVIFRFIPGNRDPRRFYSDPGWRVWRPWLLPLMDQVATGYGFMAPVYPKAMLARLEAGQGIDTHVDGGSSNPFVHKVHVPLQTDPEAVLTVSRTRVHLAAGYAWEVNNLGPHGAFNGSGRDRVHFIFEVFEGAGQTVFEEDAGPHGFPEARK